MARGDRLFFDLEAEDLKLFCQEADEQLDILDSDLVRLELDAEPALVQRIFRAAHTLKGSSAAIGHLRMASITHSMETVLDSVRQGTLIPTGETVDALLLALDLLRDLAMEVHTQVESGFETRTIEALLQSLTGPAEPVGRVPIEMNAPLRADRAMGGPPALPDGSAPLTLVISIARDCPLPSVRCYQVLQQLEANAELIGTIPSREVIESGNGESLIVATVRPRISVQSLYAAIRDVSDVESVTIHEAESAGGEPCSLQEPRVDARETAVTSRQAGLAAVAVANGGHVATRPAQTVRIDVERLDALMSLVGELVIDHTRLQRIREQLSGVLEDAGLAPLSENFQQTTANLGRITHELREQIMHTRMLPVGSGLARLPRLVRDVARTCNKRVELSVSGEETMLDRSVIEGISDPLVHILRNAIDHGIEAPAERLARGKPETGMIAITVWKQEAHVYLSIKDDGRGIATDILRRMAIERGLVSAEAARSVTDEAALQYIFLAGLTTAKAISDVSGRGVGMDIVRTNVERLHGQVHVRSMVGKGSEFIIQLPLTEVTTKALMVRANDVTYAVPLGSVTEVVARSRADISNIAGQATLRLRNHLIPVVDLGRALGDGSDTAHPCSGGFVIAAHDGDRQVGFLVDDILGEQDVVVKSLGTMLGNRRGVTGATFFGDGTFGLIVDTASLIADHAIPKTQSKTG